MELLYLFCRAKKSRLGSHIVNFYGQKKHRLTNPDRFPSQKRVQTFDQMLKTCMTWPKEDRLKVFDHIIVESYNGLSKDEVLKK